MAEHAAEYEWRGEGDEAEIILYAPDSAAFERVLPAAGLPGVESPVYAAASPEGLGWVAASTSHAAPDLLSVPTRGLLLVADAALGDLEAPEERRRLISRRLSETRLPHATGTGVRRICESGARAAAEDGLIEETDLRFFDQLAGDADAVGRRAVSAGTRDWDLPGTVSAHGVGEIVDAEAAERLGLEPGALALVCSAEAGDLGRLALGAHRERILSRIRSGTDFGAEDDLPAAPFETEEAFDLLAATSAAANFADGRTGLLLYALRRALGDLAGGLRLRAAWRVGGIEGHEGSLVHRRDLAAAGEGEVVVSGGSVVAGTGKMCGSVPPFGTRANDGSLPWEEAGVLVRWADLDPTEGRT